MIMICYYNNYSSLVFSSILSYNIILQVNYILCNSFTEHYLCKILVKLQVCESDLFIYHSARNR